MKFNEYATVVVSAGYDRSVRAWDCRSQSTEPIQVKFLFFFFTFYSSKKILTLSYVLVSKKSFSG